MPWRARSAAEIGQQIEGIGRISGLNPSGPGIDGMQLEQRLDRGDAAFVGQ